MSQTPQSNRSMVRIETAESLTWHVQTEITRARSELEAESATRTRVMMSARRLEGLEAALIEREGALIKRESAVEASKALLERLQEEAKVCAGTGQM